ncbi:uncharacterized protein LOC107770464 [Nicotiana tabacum]|uniref:Uncharacterized protein LOC107770464 n=1 Tax=Nicotiana tabacum TaxID=4097 RepID=A0A1S3XZJ3_TOBAC|nr:uncharacterized protein LOC104102029 isoform X1 [Nicotiana tomentosiformis]XP_016445259.1 PREDICTED: uncharacterized protein LOC107770464 [Nicotiana tabacum]
MATSASNSVTNSPISSAAHSPPPPQHQEVSSPTVPEESKEKVVKDPLDDMESRQIEKFKRYEVESSRYLMSKYFSDKTIFGGNIFDVKMTINGEQVKVSRFPGYQSYADPANFNDDSSSDTISTVETTPLSANGQQPSNKGY